MPAHEPTTPDAARPPRADQCHREVLTRYDWPSQRLRDEATLMLAGLMSNALLHGGVRADEDSPVRTPE